MGTPGRPRLATTGLLLATIGAGLASRAFAEVLPTFVSRHAGDALWAMMVFWVLALIRPGERTGTLALTALGVAFAVELSQLYQANWIEKVRATPLGALALGHGFLWADVPRYAAGVMLATLIDLARCPRGAPELDDLRGVA